MYSLLKPWFILVAVCRDLKVLIVIALDPSNRFSDFMKIDLQKHNVQINPSAMWRISFVKVQAFVLKSAANTLFKHYRSFIGKKWAKRLRDYSHFKFKSWFFHINIGNPSRRKAIRYRHRFYHIKSAAFFW